MENGWKITAIVLMCVCFVETCFIGWTIKAGGEMIERENTCAVNICDVGNENEAFYYDDWEEICYCFQEGEISYQKYIGG